VQPVSEWNYIVAAYTLTWIAIAGYAIHLARRLRRAASDLTNVSADGSGNER
jgi:CcmD family protein